MNNEKAKLAKQEVFNRIDEKVEAKFREILQAGKPTNKGDEKKMEKPAEELEETVPEWYKHQEALRKLQAKVDEKDLAYKALQSENEGLKEIKKNYDLVMRHLENPNSCTDPTHCLVTGYITNIQKRAHDSGAAEMKTKAVKEALPPKLTISGATVQTGKAVEAIANEVLRRLKGL